MRIALLLLASLNALAAGRELSPRAAGPTSYYASGVQTAFAGHRFLTIWSEWKGEIGYAVLGMLHDASGRRITSRAFPIGSPGAGQMHLVGAGDSFALFWSNGSQTFLTDIDHDGRAARTTTLALPAYTELKAAWNGSKFLVVLNSYADGHATHAFLLTRGGTIARADLLAAGELHNFSISPFDGGFTLVSPGNDGVCARRITNGGIVEWTRCLPPDGSWLLRSTTLGNGSTLMVWGGSREVRSAIVHADGTLGPVRDLLTEEISNLVHLGRAGAGAILTFISGPGWPLQLRSLVIDAEGAAASPVRSVTPVAGSYSVTAASTGQATLAVFEDPAAKLSRSKSIVIANDGAPAGPPQELMIAPARQTQPALANTGSRLLAAWTDRIGDDSFVVTSALRTDGQPLFDRTVSRGELASRELPWNGSAALLFTWEIERPGAKLRATLIDQDGSPMGSAAITVGETPYYVPGAPATAAWAEDRWLVTWATPVSGLNVGVIRGGALTATNRIAVSTPVPPHHGRTFAHLAMARNATTTLLAWTEEHDPICGTLPPCGYNQYRTYVARVSPEGELLDATPLELPSGEHSLAIATSGDEFMVLTDGMASVLDAGGRRVVASTTIFGWNAGGDVTWNGSAYAVALRYQLMNWYLSYTELDRDGNVLAGSRGIQTLAAETVEAPSLAGSAIALQEGDAAATRAVAYDESQLMPLPPPPAAPRPRFQQDEELGFEITWDPVPGAELYTVEGELGYWPWWRREVIRADRQLRSWMPPASRIRVTAVGPGGTSLPPMRHRASRH